MRSLPKERISLALPKNLAYRFAEYRSNLEDRNDRLFLALAFGFAIVHNITKLLVNVIDEPLVDDRFLEPPFLADFGGRYFLLLRPGVDGLGLQLEIGGDFLQCHDIGLQPGSSLLLLLSERKHQRVRGGPPTSRS